MSRAVKIAIVCAHGAAFGAALSAAPATAAETATITLEESVEVTGKRITLDELAEIVGPAQEAEALGTVDVGPAPLPGRDRGLTVGYLKMRLRRGGIDCWAVTFDGAERVQVHRRPEVTPAADGEQASDAEGDAEAGAATAPAPKPIVVERRSRVHLAVVCGAVRILAEATTLEDAVVGEMARMRVEQTREMVYAELTSRTQAVIRRQ